MANNNYITVSTPGTKKISVCAKRIGSRDRMRVMAVCTEELEAERIVDALNLLQGKTAALEVPAQRTLAEVRVQLANERNATNTLRTSLKTAENKLRETEYQLAQRTRERDAAQKNARETA